MGKIEEGKIIVLDYNVFVFSSIFAWRIKKNIPFSYLLLNSIITCLRKIGVSPFDTVYITTDFLKSWRKQYAEEYKANRKEIREKYTDIDWQKTFNTANELLNNLDKGTEFIVVKGENLEADDLASFIVRHNKDREIVLCTIDSDWEMLWHVSDKVKIFSPRMKPKRYKLKPKNYNFALELAKKIKCERADNLISKIKTEEDYEVRKMCVEGHTWILTPKGAKEIRYLKKGAKIWSYNFRKQIIEPKKILKVFKTFSKERLKIQFLNQKTNSKARRLLITKNHPILTKEGWKKAGLLKPGDIVLRNHDLYNKIKRGVDNVGYKLGYIHGYFAGDGHESKRDKSLHFTSIDKEGIIRINQYIKDLFKFKINIRITNNRCGKLFHLHIPGYLKALRFFKTGKNYGQAYEKGFLGGFFDAEGSLYKSKRTKPRWTISITNTNKELIFYVYNIIKKFHLHPKIHMYKRKNPRYKDYWKLDINKIFRVFNFFLIASPAIKRKYPDLSILSNGYTIKSIEKLNIKHGKFTNWNLEIEDNHNYFANGVLVHNCVDLTELPPHIEKQIDDIFVNLKEKENIDINCLPYASLREKIENLYNEKNAIVTYEWSVAFEEKKKLKLAKKRKVKK